jgi:serine/threonine-protein kinase
VLIKALSSSILPSSPFAATLEREARLLAELRHPNILQVYDFVRRDDRMWLVLEDVDGWPLDELIVLHGALPPLAASAIALEAARALEHAHQHGIIHREVQPRNLTIARDGSVKLVNFAIAVDDRLPSLPELLDGSGNAARQGYMSPEQILGEPADPRSDLFSLGVVLYEALAGKRPFEGPDERTTTQRIRHDAPAPLAQATTELPAGLERLVARCLEKLPTDRYQSATELARALESVCGHVMTAELIRDYLRRHKLIPKARTEPKPSEPALRKLPATAPGRVIAGLVGALGLILIGGAGLQLAARTDGSAERRPSGQRLELVPARTGYLRVVADPWAHVIVDGQKVATTPFASPIPLSAGTHHVRLEHPNAPVERRTVELTAGETLLLDVKMGVPFAEPLPSEISSSAMPSDAGTDAAWSP